MNKNQGQEQTTEYYYLALNGCASQTKEINKIRMYFPFGIWQLITSFLVHNIRTQGKHLKSNPVIQQYNRVMLTIPKPYASQVGPKVVFSSATQSPRFVKFMYHSPFFTTQYHRYIIEYQIWKEGTAYLDDYQNQYQKN